ncbi:uncharacterized protein LOC110631145 isoform X2 [Manihot esculenta]|uniref:Uncharacterized protein n=3 Tax=Manihot esculenta TaxID=3983 RepID=A0A251JSK3_MANES|nr:uncharacterized protein LOC110631145 isoform X2 [Manihot esculenta]KAG8639004.1 hypothetical protein MANES_14G089200v8 [Manihot esculenta]KAG8639006.1 hypothetical protein MANES_14G089200v8 [Manihot esculenta]OAY31163.1 hypothetical protein MANES_14G089200v8 [Manihot esculenta]OAY31164.1 hypothetical protein MANES_14G089200v8 [Manihot esculenta]
MRGSRLIHNERNCASEKMFQFIRELNMIYADENPGTESRLNLNDLPVYKSFEFIDNSGEPKGLIQDQNLRIKPNRKKQHGVLRNRKGSDGFRSSDDSSRYAKSSIGESEGSMGRKKVYLKKDLHDYDSPEMVCFLDDSSYDFIKDILTETEPLSQDKYLTENYELDHCNFSSTVNSDSESSDSTQETLERLSCIANELKFIAEDDCKNERHNSKRFLTDEDGLDKGDDDVMIDHPAKNIVHVIHLSEEVKDDDCENEQHGCRRLTMGDEEGFQGRRAISIDHSVEDIVRTIQLIKGVQMEEEGALSNPNCKQVLENDSLSSCPESLRISSDKESLASSIEADRPSDQIENSGSSIIEHSGGSISLTSSNSTASTRSFAFPVLTTEWPASPVRMRGGDETLRQASADHRRRMHRPRRWKALFCCKSKLR